MDEHKNEIEEIQVDTKAGDQAEVETLPQAVEEVVESMDDYAKEIEQSMARVSEGDIVDCSIISLNEDELIVSFGYIADGVVTKEELLLEKDEKITDKYAIGDQFKAEVMTLNNGEGNVALSVKKAAQIIIWEELAIAKDQEEAITVKIKEVVKGGLVALVSGVRVFMPASMVASTYVDDLALYVGQELKVLVVEVDQADKKVIVSHKEIDAKEREEARLAFYSQLAKGQVYAGVVKKLMNFGAFVDIGGVDGLLHVHEMSWKRLKHPSEVVKEGEKVEVYIIDVDRDQERISLGLKNIGESPWENIDQEFKVGQTFEGVVARLTKFGAFVRLKDGVEGLVHISEISHDRINMPKDVLSEGETVRVKILDLQKAQQKLSLSIKATTEDDEHVEIGEFVEDEAATTSLKNVFADILKKLEQ